MVETRDSGEKESIKEKRETWKDGIKEREFCNRREDKIEERKENERRELHVL